MIPDSTAQPARPLGEVGQELWGQVWQVADWIDPSSDAEAVLLLCEAMDERTLLRASVLENANWRERAALRALDAQITALMDQLGLNPTSRQRLSVQTEESPFDELARRRFKS